MIKKDIDYVDRYLQEINKKFKIYCKNDQIKLEIINGIKEYNSDEESYYKTFIRIVARIKKCYGKDIKIGKKDGKLIDLYCGNINKKNMRVWYETHKYKMVTIGYEIHKFEMKPNTTLENWDPSRY